MKLSVDFTKRFTNGPTIEVAFDLELQGFGITVLVGPSGCGKSTLLRVLAGLERPERGSIYLDGEPWLDGGRCLPAHQRRLGFLHQEDTLFPHLSVAGNLAYGLGDRPGVERRHQIAEALARFGLEGLEHRYPRELSGGQRQRVALARALVRRPRLLLLDEPLTGLDPCTRELARRELRGMLRAWEIPVLLVTHDRTEALHLGDRLMVMDEGRLLQEGDLESVFAHPTHPRVADILGVETIHTGRVMDRREGLVSLEIEGIPVLAVDPGGLGERAHVCIRGEDVVLELGAVGSTARNRWPGHITGLRPEGPLVRIALEVGFPLEALVTRPACQELGLHEGQPVTAVVKAPAIHLIPRD